MWSNKHLTAAEALAAGRRLLPEDMAFDAEVLLRYVLQVDRTGLFREPERLLTCQEKEELSRLLQRRRAGEPVAYLTGSREFMGLDFTVSPLVLIPRPETELLVEHIIENLRPISGLTRIIDVGTGSGAIAVSLAYTLTEAQLWAVDVSQAALETARHNATKHQVQSRINFVLSNLLAGVPPELLGIIDWIAANLPYIPDTDIPNLQRDVTAFEPHLALAGGPDGLDLYRQLLPQAAQTLKPGGHIIMEMGHDQGPALASLLPEETWSDVHILQDYAGLDRFVTARKRDF
ncbi:MAG TPA: peptide chain release factor N(5)-glutamine methyltransferase [Bacillota bacterium]|nr:peptide chain release factor N(5)-glutamine methyltransferase [Bacillota bacterium]